MKLFEPRGTPIKSTGATPKSAGDYIRQSFRGPETPHLRLKALAEQLAARRRVKEQITA